MSLRYEYYIYDKVAWTKADNEKVWSCESHSMVPTSLCRCVRCKKQLQSALHPFIRVDYTYVSFRYDDPDKWYFCPVCAREEAKKETELGLKIRAIIPAFAQTTNTELPPTPEFCESNRFKTLDY